MICAKRCWVAGIAIGVLFGTVTRAEEGEQAAAGEDRFWKVTLNARATYDDNRDGTATNTQDNVDFDLGARLDLRRTGTRTDVEFFYGPWIRLRSDPREGTGDQNDVDVYHDAGLFLDHWPSTRIRLKLSERFGYLDDPSVTEAGLTLRESSSYIHNRLMASAACAVAPMTSLEVIGRYSLKRYEEEDVAVFADEDRASASAIALCQLQPELKVGAEGTYAMTDFEGTEAGQSIVTVAGVAENAFSPRLHGRLRAGYQTVEHDQAVEDSMGAPFVKASLIVLPAGASRVELWGSYSLEPSDVATYASQQRTSAGATVSHDVTERLTASVGGYFANGAYDGDARVVDNAGAPVLPTAGETSDDLLHLRVKGTFQVSRTVLLEAAYEYEDWDSDIRESFTRNRVSLGCRVQL